MSQPRDSAVDLKQECRYQRAKYLIEKIKKDGGQFNDREKQRILAALG